jgi:hypothetical protein
MSDEELENLRIKERQECIQLLEKTIHSEYALTRNDVITYQKAIIDCIKLLKSK